jgi:hypothetical protein
LFDYSPFQRVTDDAFFLVIESLDPRFMEVETPEFLEEIGGREVTLLYENDWISSPDYRWASTMWGVYIFAGAAGAGMALLILVVLGLRSAGYLTCVNQQH